MIPLIYDQSYEEILLTYFEYYAREFGERKATTVGEKIKSSNKIAKLILEADQKRAILTHLDIITCINTIPFFIFSSGQTQALGSLIALDLWNSDSKYSLANEHDLKHIAINIIKESASTFHYPKQTSTSNLKERFQMSDMYPDENSKSHQEKIEENIKILVHQINKVVAKDNNALIKNIHYTVLLVILRQVRQKENFNQKLLSIDEKKVLQMILCNSTPMFCIAALMIHSKQLSKYLGRCKSKECIEALLYMANNAVFRANPNTKCSIGISHYEYDILRTIITEISKRQDLNNLFNHA